MVVSRACFFAVKTSTDGGISCAAIYDLIMALNLRLIRFLSFARIATFFDTTHAHLKPLPSELIESVKKEPCRRRAAFIDSKSARVSRFALGMELTPRGERAPFGVVASKLHDHWRFGCALRTRGFENAYAFLAGMSVSLATVYIKNSKYQVLRVANQKIACAFKSCGVSI